MIAGILIISIAFVAALLSTVSYGFYHKERDERLLMLGNLFFYICGGMIVLSAVLLSYSLMTHNFQLNYVYSYSSRSLSKFYLFSTFWAGQEGTFLLWLFYGTIFGAILIKTVGRKQPLVLTFLMTIHSFILLILLSKNPFAAIWHVHQEAPVGFTPVDGRGLNPLLQNPWMVIHPPTLFIGYSSTMIPFAFAMAALITKDFHNWIKMVKPWAIFSALILITGISMGGYWAYVTLGWGGYWAWDPVENASLVPWLFSVALLHGIVIQQKRRTLVRTNLILAGGAFITMLWGSFLTRSGVLTDFSVHSFAASGLSMYLIIFVALFTGIFLFAFFRNTRGLKAGNFSDGLLNRETLMLMGMATFIVLGLIVLVGTSAPIYTSYLGEPSSVSPPFYNVTSIPVAVIMLISVALAPLLAWKISELRNKNTIIRSALIAFGITAIAILIGLRESISILLFFLSAFAIVINGIVSYGLIRKNFSKAGGYIAHVGFGLMIIGIITSSIYDTSEKVILPDGEFQKTRFGYEIKFTGFREMPDGKDEVDLVVKTKNGTYQANPKFYYSDYSQSYMASPHVNENFVKDIYISPISFTPASMANMQEVVLAKQETKTLGNIKVTFNKFNVDMSPGAQIIHADIVFAVNQNSYWQDYEVKPVLKVENGQTFRDKAKVGDTGYYVQVESVNPGAGTVQLGIITPAADMKQAKDILAVEVSEKPLISILWIGIILLVVGMVGALFSRRGTVE